MENSPKQIAIDTLDILTMSIGLITAGAIAGAKTATSVSGGIAAREGAIAGAAMGVVATFAVVWMYRKDIGPQIKSIALTDFPSPDYF